MLYNLLSSSTLFPPSLLGTELFPQKVVCGSLNPQCNCIWRWAFKEIIQVHWGHMEGFSCHRTDALTRRGRGAHSLSPHIEESLMRHSEKLDEFNWVGREVSLEMNPDGSLILDFSLQDCEKRSFCCLSHPVCGVSLWQPEQIDTPCVPASLTSKLFSKLPSILFGDCLCCCHCPGCCPPWRSPSLGPFRPQPLVGFLSPSYRR